MPDTKVQMNVTLTDGTVINAGQFTVPQGPAGKDGAQGPAGADGVTPLQATGIASVSAVPIVNGTTNVPQATFNRMPVVGETCVLYVNYLDSNNLRKFYITRAEVTIAASISTVKFQSVVEYGIGIKSVSVVEVTA